MKLEESLGSMRERLGGLHRSGTALIKKGTAMGPLIPLVTLVPILGFLAWVFRDVAVLATVPLFSAVCFAVVLVIVGAYICHYSRFAREDPDRLQSERFRVSMEQLQVQRIQAKDGLLVSEAPEPPTGNPEAVDSDGKLVDVFDEEREQSQ